jgi:hypothetical protein
MSDRLPSEWVPCARCGEKFERKPHTGRKYCDGACAQIVKAEANAVRQAKKRIPIVDHKDGCACGGCLGVESRRV